MSKMMVCSSCGCEYSEKLAKCPACGNLNYQAAEAEYLKKLDNVRKELSELSELPETVVKKELKKQGRLLRRVLIGALFVIGAFAALFYFSERQFERDEKQDFLWQESTFPEWDALYEAQDYEALVLACVEAMEDNRSAWNYPHEDFCEIYMSYLTMQEALAELEADREALSAEEYAWLLYDELTVAASRQTKELDEDELLRLSPLIEEAAAELLVRWGIAEEDYEQFMSWDDPEYMWMDYEKCEAYIEEHREEAQP